MQQQNILINLFLLAVIAAGNVLLSFYYGNNGYEAFLTACLGLLILMHWQLAQLISVVKRDHGLFLSILVVPPLGIIWMILFAALMVCLTYTSDAAGSVRLETNWLLVFAGAVPYLLPRLLVRATNSIETSSINLLVTIYSVVFAAIAIVSFGSQDSIFGKTILVIALELQVLIAFIFAKTSFVTKVIKNTESVKRRYFANDDNAMFYTVVGVVGAALLGPALLLISLPLLF